MKAPESKLAQGGGGAGRGWAGATGRGDPVFGRVPARRDLFLVALLFSRRVFVRFAARNDYEKTKVLRDFRSRPRLRPTVSPRLVARRPLAPAAPSTPFMWPAARPRSGTRPGRSAGTPAGCGHGVPLVAFLFSRRVFVRFAARNDYEKTKVYNFGPRPRRPMSSPAHALAGRCPLPPGPCADVKTAHGRSAVGSVKAPPSRRVESRLPRSPPPFPRKTRDSCRRGGRRHW